MTYQRPSIADVGLEIGACVLREDESEALRLAFRCVELFDRAIAPRVRFLLEELYPGNERKIAQRDARRRAGPGTDI